ncbi:Beta-N-acetylhexosaminidase [Lentibacillus sp. JNUCC-1]|uniref:GNAT family N-acetyltransferase n=1 Tax=Lentibacillus sp. JNUCC-1 TaxID=2654513 RepID=UPI00132C7AD1|nr:GNAT family N-acetyltransferase [Lentibacillus sp. JNUCC-1]MUV39022.1 Beta-N-acetylhexosaminidase [Lentibacillus sp. JNUCC-1]
MKIAKWNDAYFDDLVKLWNQELADEFPMRKALFEQNSFKDKNISWEGSAVALDNFEQVIGFIAAKQWQEELAVDMPATTGWIQVLLVDQEHRNRGVGTQLLKHAESVLQSHGAREILLGRDPWHYFPGVPNDYSDTKDWFEKKGYQAYANEYDLLQHYGKNEPITHPEFPEADVSLLKQSEKEAFLAFLNRCFPGRWEYEAIKYFEQGGTGREFVILKKAGNIIGFCRVNDPDAPLIAQNTYWAPLFEGDLGGVGPLGVDASERGQGYGLAIVEAGIAELRRRGIQDIVIDWTGLVDFYKKLGYDIWKSYVSYKKPLNGLEEAR